MKSLEFGEVFAFRDPPGRVFFFFFFKPGQTCSCLVLQNPNCTVLDVDDAVLSGL